VKQARLEKSATRMLSLMLVLSLIGLSGCALLPKRVIIAGGPEDVLVIPMGSSISNIPLPTDENKTYTIVTQKDGLWISLDADQRTWV